MVSRGLLTPKMLEELKVEWSTVKKLTLFFNINSLYKYSNFYKLFQEHKLKDRGRKHKFRR